VISCVVHYVTDFAKLADFERFAARWIDLVQRHGGVHHGYFLPAEGASDADRSEDPFPGDTPADSCHATPRVQHAMR
jgi:hypothetical protein